MFSVSVPSVMSQEQFVRTRPPALCSRSTSFLVKPHVVGRDSSLTVQFPELGPDHKVIRVRSRVQLGNGGGGLPIM